MKIKHSRLACLALPGLLAFPACSREPCCPYPKLVEEVSPASTQPLTGPPRQGEYAQFTKWDKYTYAIESSYPYVTALPSPDRVPAIIDYLARCKDTTGGVPESQLTCLTRVSFEHSHGKPPLNIPQAWHNWWDTVGQEYFARLDTQGKRNPEAWKLLVGDANIPCPDYKILIPDQWHCEVTFRTGDYSGVQQEIIRMERTGTTASLKRRYSVRTNAPFQYETWHGFTPQEADRFLYALAYAIDQPWFVKQFTTPKTNTPGRNWSNYYAGAHWSGVVLPDGRVWWNDDPCSWHSTSHEDYEQVSLDAGCRTVYPFVCYHYPEKRSVSGSDGWEPDLGAQKTPWQ